MSDEPDLWAKLYGDRQGEPLTTDEQRLVAMVDDLRKRDQLTKLAGTGVTVEVKNPRLDALEKRLERIESMLGAASWERVGRGTLPSCDRCRDSIRTEVDWDSQALRERLRDMKVVSGPFSRLLLDPDGGALRQQWYAYVEKVES